MKIERVTSECGVKSNISSSRPARGQQQNCFCQPQARNQHRSVSHGPIVHTNIVSGVGRTRGVAQPALAKSYMYDECRSPVAIFQNVRSASSLTRSRCLEGPAAAAVGATAAADGIPQSERYHFLAHSLTDSNQYCSAYVLLLTAARNNEAVAYVDHIGLLQNLFNCRLQASFDGKA
jgi:hypothetical protein